MANKPVLRKLLPPSAKQPQSSAASAASPTPEPVSCFDPGMLWHAVLVNRLGKQALVSGRSLDELRDEVQTALDELKGSAITLSVYQGRRIPVRKNSLELELSEDELVPLLEVEEPDAPEDGIVLEGPASNMPPEADSPAESGIGAGISRGVQW